MITGATPEELERVEDQFEDFVRGKELNLEVCRELLSFFELVSKSKRDLAYLTILLTMVTTPRNTVLGDIRTRKERNE